MKNWIGKSILVIGILHTVFGLIVFSDVMLMIVREGLFNTIDGQPIKEAAFWFLFTGFLSMILGGCVDWIEKRSLPIPPFLKWSISLLTLLGCIIMPKSGFWLLILPSIGLFVHKDQKKTGKKKKVRRKG